MARDFNRFAQEQRKSAGLEVSDRIHVRYAASERVAGALSLHHDWLCQELLALSLEAEEGLEGPPVQVGAEELRLKIEKAEASS